MRQGSTITRNYPALTTHTSSPRSRLCFGAQTAYTGSDRLKQLKRFTAGRFVLDKTKQFWNCFVSVSFQNVISPVPKISSPKDCNDYRPISVTPVLTRTMERLVVRTSMYPALLTPPPALMFSDQYAFRPTGSTTAALVFLLQTITNLLAEQP